MAGSDTKIGVSVALASAQKNVVILPSTLPTGEYVIFKDSSFFRRNSSTSVLPSPADVLTEARRAGVVQRCSPPPVHYPSLGLTIKYGIRVYETEGQCLWALGRLPDNMVPVPEVYGWTKEDGITYIYMEYIPGETLGQRRDSLLESEKRGICNELRAIVSRLRTLQPDGEKFIGSISHRPLLDLAFRLHSSRMGPFTSVAEFHDQFVDLSHPNTCDSNDPPHPFRRNLPDDAPIIFTHGDLHRGNVIISSSAEGGSPRVKSIIDRGQAGWYPDYWEYCKVRWSADESEDWDSIYIPLFLDHFDCYNYWDYFLPSMGV